MADSTRDGLDLPPAPTPHEDLPDAVAPPAGLADTERPRKPTAQVHRSQPGFSAADLPFTDPIVPTEATPTTPYRGPGTDRQTIDPAVVPLKRLMTACSANMNFFASLLAVAWAAIYGPANQTPSSLSPSR